MKCQYCGAYVDLPFRCPFCGGYFCPDHRLPENHGCPELLKVRTQKPTVSEKLRPTAVEGRAEPAQRETLVSYPFRFRKTGWTSRTETAHLVIGAVIVMMVGLSLYRPVDTWIFSIFQETVVLVILALIFTGIFLIHELAHKAAAKHYGLWAEFRLNLGGALLTLVSVIFPLKFVLPGAVMIAGAADKKTMGVTALAGPLTSIVYALLFFFLHFFVPEYSSAILDGASLGAWIALFNLLPVSVFDGAKVLWWNKSVWTISFIVSVLLAIATLGYWFS